MGRNPLSCIFWSLLFFSPLACFFHLLCIDWTGFLFFFNCFFFFSLRMPATCYLELIISGLNFVARQTIVSFQFVSFILETFDGGYLISVACWECASLFFEWNFVYDFMIRQYKQAPWHACNRFMSTWIWAILYLKIYSLSAKVIMMIMMMMVMNDDEIHTEGQKRPNQSQMTLLRSK